MILSEDFPKLIRKHIALFDSFEHVYLFGSALVPNIFHNDIDILAIYAQYSTKIGDDLKLISDELGKVSGLHIDLTVLSTEEEIDTAFLEKLKYRYIKLK